MSRTAVLMVSALLTPVGCGGVGLWGPVEVRVENGSTLTFDDGILYVGGDSILFPDLKPGEATPYKEVERAYRIATVRVVSGTDTTGLQPIDFVGEKRLRPGRYTYVLSFFEGNPRDLIMGLRRDD
jgi:hypothetical protein